MTEVETELDSRYDDIDVESVLARCQRHVPISFSRKTLLYQAPEFIKRLPSTEEVIEGSTVTFMCQVAGFPKPTITWYRDEEVLGPESRAQMDEEDSGIHSINIKDVSKCDAGIYKIHASNLEGSSKSMLYISVKARSKRRTKKKSKRSREVARSPLFPAIIERVAEEQKATLENENLPESPLTPLYCTISRKAPVMWPVFLGDWAYNEDEALQRGEIEELDIGCEDVFDTDDDIAMTENLTFVSKAYAHVCDADDPAAEISSQHIAPNKEFLVRTTDSSSASMDIDKGNLEKLTKRNGDVSGIDSTQIVCKKNSLLARTENCYQINNNNDKDATVHTNERTDREQFSNSCHARVQDQRELTDNFCDTGVVSIISVHRSYAKGDSSSSVARRSPSPFSGSRNRIDCTNNGVSDWTDTTTLQNLNNERLLHRMNKEASLCHWCYCILISFATSTKWDNYLWEIFLFICGSTFLALCFNLPPATFIYYILMAMFIKMVLYLVLEDV